jgi:8-oxo-dGTP pyrophosphatase MutT (NUDIX family)
MYNPEIVITEELQKQFEVEADKVIAKMIEKMAGAPVPKELEFFRDGYISALGNIYLKNKGVPSIPYPVSLSTVDMVCISNTNDGIQIMMGRKPGQPKWQFPGGFRDPKETSRQAAARELSEEATLFNVDSTHHCYRVKAGAQNAYSRLESIGELFVDDIRYRELPHKITTSIFLLELTEEEISVIKPGDDLGEIKWYSLNELSNDTSVIRDIHLPIFNLVSEYLLPVAEVA